MRDMWNERYRADEYAYGTDGNSFLKEELKKLPKGKILLPADGEGRNACMAAELNWQVTSFDFSLEGVEKAKSLALKKNVAINTFCCGYEDFHSNELFDVVALIYAHMPNRSAFHKIMLNYLKPGGTLILEAFNKKQLGRNSGGPKNESMLFNLSELEQDFEELRKIKLWETTATLSEGKYHTGEAELIRVVGVK